MSVLDTLVGAESIGSCLVDGGWTLALYRLGTKATTGIGSTNGLARLELVRESFGNCIRIVALNEEQSGLGDVLGIPLNGAVFAYGVVERNLLGVGSRIPLAEERSVLVVSDLVFFKHRLDVPRLVFAEEIDDVALRGQHFALGVAGVVLAKESRLDAVVHGLTRPTDNLVVAVVERELALAIVEGGVQIDGLWGVVPCTAERYNRALRLHGAAVEDIALVACIGVAGRDGIATRTCAVALLAVEQYILEIGTTVTADVVYRAVNLAVLEIVGGTNLVGIVGVLIREQAHIFANGVVTLVPQGYGTTIVCLVVVEGVLEGEVLQVDVVTRQEKRGGVVDRLGRRIRRIADDGFLHRLTDNAYAIYGNLGKHFLAEVVGAVGQENAVALLHLQQRQD